MNDDKIFAPSGGETYLIGQRGRSHLNRREMLSLIGTTGAAAVFGTLAANKAYGAACVEALPEEMEGPLFVEEVYAPVAGLQQSMLPYVQGYWPAPNGPELGGGIASYFGNPVQTIREDYGTVRVDHRFSDKDSLNGSYTIDDGFLTSPEADPVISDVLYQRAQTGSIQETHIFTANLI